MHGSHAPVPLIAVKGC